MYKKIMSKMIIYYKVIRFSHHVKCCILNEVILLFTPTIGE